jgi:PKD repeat protein
MSIQLPNSPTNGQQYIGSNGVTYTFDGTKWVGAGGGSAPPVGGYTVGPSAPPSPITGQQWFNTSTSPGVLTLFGTDSAWHAVTSGGGGGGAVIPVASFTRTPSSGTAPLSVTFTDTSTNSPTSWAWNFGDGSSGSTAQNPVHSYASAGTYNVTFTASNSAGTSAMYTQNSSVSVSAGGAGVPVASFTKSPASGNAPLSVNFTDTSSNSPTSWSWNFGDGTTSTAQNPVHSYGFAGTYTVTLIATNGLGSSAMYTQNGAIVVSTASAGVPVASFTRTPSSGTAPLSVTFTDTSTNSPTSWAWNFGDGTTSTLQNPVHSYAAAGTYAVTHSASNASGTSSILTQAASVTVTTASVGEVLAFSGTTFVQAAGATPAHVPRGDNFTINLSGGTPNTGATWSLTAPAGSTQAISSVPLSLNGSGAASFPNLYFDTVGTYVLTITFASTGHIRTFATNVTAGTSETVALSHNNPVTTTGPGVNLTITGGVPNSTYSFLLITKPAGSTAAVSGSGFPLDSSGNSYDWVGLKGDIPGDYVYQFTFAGTNHVRVAPTIVTI